MIIKVSAELKIDPISKSTPRIVYVKLVKSPGTINFINGVNTPFTKESTRLFEASAVITPIAKPITEYFFKNSSQQH